MYELFKTHFDTVIKNNCTLNKINLHLLIFLSFFEAAFNFFGPHRKAGKIPYPGDRKT